jgi:tetratricopeptide (TPR) repeat protein
MKFQRRRKKPSIKNVLVLIILIGVLPYSYFHSAKIYAFYMRTYYERILGQNVEQLTRKGEEMYGNKDYPELMNYLTTLVGIYPENMELRRLEGLTQIKLGQSKIGTDTILSSAGGKKIPEKTLIDAVNSLYELKDYRDIVMIMKKNDPGEHKGLLRHYGISLAKIGDFRAALPVLKRALAQGGADREVYLQLGMAYNSLNEPRMAIPYLERSREMEANDPDAAASLAQAYRKLGRYKDAEKILRKMTR